MDQPAEAHVAHHGPGDLHDLLLGVMLEQVVEELLVDVVVVDEEALGIAEGGLLGVGEVVVAPGANAGDGILFEGLSSP